MVTTHFRKGRHAVVEWVNALFRAARGRGSPPSLAVRVRSKCTAIEVEMDEGGVTAPVSYGQP